MLDTIGKEREERISSTAALPSPRGYRYYCCHFRLSFVDVGGQRMGSGGVGVWDNRRGHGGGYVGKGYPTAAAI